MRMPQDRILHIGTEIKDGKVNVMAEWQGELVRCKDCQYWTCKDSSHWHNNHICNKWNNGTSADDFCSYGERREGMIKAEWTNKDSLDLQSTCNQLATNLQPTEEDNISRADVYKWERDIALSQLEEYGIGFAEKKRDDLVSVVRCKDCRHRDLFSCPLADNDFQKDDDYCSWGELAEQTDNKLPGYDEIMEKLDELTLKGGDHE